MNEARRFLRYITPGILFGFLALFFVWLALPDWTMSVLKDWFLTGGNSIAIIITTLLLSGALGYLFATIHHWCHWHLPIDNNVINHVQQIESLRKRNLIPSLDSTPPNPRLEALIIISILWFERLEKGTPVGNSEDRVAAFGDISHAAGTARVASVLALVTALSICIFRGSLDLSVCNIFRYVVMVVLGSLTICLFHDAYRRTGNIAQELYNQILEHSLLQEQERNREKKPLNNANSADAKSRAAD